MEDNDIIFPHLNDIVYTDEKNDLVDFESDSDDEIKQNNDPVALERANDIDDFMEACRTNDVDSAKNIAMKYKNNENEFINLFTTNKLCEALCNAGNNNCFEIIDWILEFFDTHGYITEEHRDYCSLSPFEAACESGNLMLAQKYRKHTPPYSYHALEMCRQEPDHEEYFKKCANLGRISEEKMRQYMIETESEISDLEIKGEALFNKFIEYTGYNNYGGIDFAGLFYSCVNYKLDVADWFYSFDKIDFDSDDMTYFIVECCKINKYDEKCKKIIKWLIIHYPEITPNFEKVFKGEKYAEFYNNVLKEIKIKTECLAWIDRIGDKLQEEHEMAKTIYDENPMLYIVLNLIV